MADVLIYKVGSQPGAPLSLPDVLNNRQGPQAREPSKCLDGWSYRETGKKGLLIASYKRLKKRLIGP